MKKTSLFDDERDSEIIKRNEKRKNNKLEKMNRQKEKWYRLNGITLDDKFQL